MPASGRDGDEYRDAWIETADRVGALVASLGYPEAHYDFAAYQLGGVVRDLTLPAGARDSNVVQIRDEDIVFAPNPEPDTWLFNDFDRVFALLKRATGSDDNGDAAGGIMLHTPLVDQQGLGRLDRGRYFFEQAEHRARAMDVPLAWRLRTVPGVGHNFRAMSQAAASLLFP